MISFKNPLTPIIVNPVNIDRPIQEIQISLATGLGWLEKSFGRSWESVRKDTSGKIWTYPEVWQGPGVDLYNCMPNDNLKSQSFFRVEEPIKVIEYQEFRYARMNAIINIIFWFNLQVIDPDLDYRFIELLKGHVQRVLTNTSLSSSDFQILQIWEGANNVFKGYTIDQFKNQELIHPYGGFRFECNLNFIEDCPDTVFET
jgi:hypothetical protein